MNGVYKLVEIDRIPTMKLSSNKLTYPGRKQIFRTMVNGQIQQDRLGLKDEITQDNEQGLLQLVMQGGQRLQSPETINTIRLRTTNSVASLPAATRQISNPKSISINISNPLESLRQSVAKQILAIKN